MATASARASGRSDFALSRTCAVCSHRSFSLAHRPAQAAQRPHVLPLLHRTGGAASPVTPAAAAAAVQAPSKQRPAGPQAGSLDPPLAYELEQGTLARWCAHGSETKPPTAVFLHGILGNKRNLKSFTRLLLKEHPAWQVLLIDLRSHGESSAPDAASSASSVDTAAVDVLQLLRHLRLFPHMLVGHSFGGKVVLSMVEQFGRNLPRPISAWVLDTVPGVVNAGVMRQGQVADHPRQLIQALLRMPTPLPSRQAAVEALQAAGFSDSVAKWVSTNLKPARPQANAASAPPSASGGEFNWGFDLPSIAEMYDSYEAKSHWDLLADPPQGLSVHFVRAEHSNFRWQGGDATRIQELGHRVHLLQNAGHWVHTDNPQGLLHIMERGLGHRDDVKHIERSYEAAKAA